MDAVTEPASSTSTTLPGASPSAGDNRLGDTTGSAGSGTPLNDVQSRMSMSEEQREIKRRFEEKQREEAQRSAHAERIAKKKARVITSSVNQFICPEMQKTLHSTRKVLLDMVSTVYQLNHR